MGERLPQRSDVSADRGVEVFCVSGLLPGVELDRLSFVQCLVSSKPPRSTMCTRHAECNIAHLPCPQTISWSWWWSLQLCLRAGKDHCDCCSVASPLPPLPLFFTAQRHVPTSIAVSG